MRPPPASVDGEVDRRTISRMTRDREQAEGVAREAWQRALHTHRGAYVNYMWRERRAFAYSDARLQRLGVIKANTILRIYSASIRTFRLRRVASSAWRGSETGCNQMDSERMVPESRPVFKSFAHWGYVGRWGKDYSIGCGIGHSVFFFFLRPAIGRRATSSPPPRKNVSVVHSASMTQGRAEFSYASRGVAA